MMRNHAAAISGSAILLLLSVTVLADTFISDISGNWGASGTWNPDSGYPGGGDTAYANHHIIVEQDHACGFLFLHNQLGLAPGYALTIAGGAYGKEGQGSLTGGGTLINNGRFDSWESPPPLGPGLLIGPATLQNNGTFRQSVGPVVLAGSGVFHNQTNALYDLRVGGAAITGGGAFRNAGTFSMNAGAVTARVEVAFQNMGGTLNVPTGTLVLASGATSSNGMFLIGSGAVLDLNDGGAQAPKYMGTYTGSGAGVVQWNAGNWPQNTDATFDLAGGLYWRGGELWAAFLRNQGLLVLDGAGTKTIRYYGQLHNYGTLRQDGGRLAITGNPNNAFVYNYPGALFDIRCDGTNVTTDYGLLQNNAGTVRKSAGTGTSVIAAAFDSWGGTLEVTSGRLDLRGGGTRSNVVMNVASGAILDLTGGGSGKYLGLVTGTVDGVVQWESGQIGQNSDVTFALTNGFYWKGGELWAGFLHNEGLLTLSGSATKTLRYYAQLENRGTIRHEEGPLAIVGNPNMAYLFNRTNGVFDIRFTGTNVSSDWGIFKNEGTLVKSAGAGESYIKAEFENWGGTIMVQTGTLVLASVGVRSNGVLQVNAGATLDLTGGASTLYKGAYTGTGSGVVQWVSGAIGNGSDASFDLPGGLWWGGGALQAAFLHNRGLMVVHSNTTKTIRYYGQLHNYGILRHEGGTVDVNGNPNTAYVVNEAGGLYDIRTDGTIMTEDYGTAQNFGTLRKSAGAGTSTLAIGFSNRGIVAAAIGTLWFNAYTHYEGDILLEGGDMRFPSFTLQAGRLMGTNVVTVAGTLTSQGEVSPGASAGRLAIAGAYSQGAAGTLAIELGGRAAGSGHDQLVVSGNAALNGWLTVSLINGFAPALGDRFPILTAGSSSGAFSSNSLPALAAGLAWKVQYGATGVDLVVGLASNAMGETVVSGDTLAGTIATAGGYVASSFYGEAGNRLLAWTAATAGTLDPLLALYAPGGGASVTGAVAGERLDGPLPVSGLYTLAVTDDGHDETGTVNLTWLKIPGAVSSPLDTDGGALAPGGAREGSITAATDMDAFHFYGVPGDQVTITLQGNGTLTPGSRLYPADGSQMEAGTGGGILTHTLTHTGLYEVVVSDVNMAHSGAYQIQLAKTPSTLRPGFYGPTPADQAGTNATAVALRWTAVAGATNYDVVVGDGAAGAPLVLATGLTTPSAVVSNRVPGDVTYWQVVARGPGSVLAGPYWWFETVSAGLWADAVPLANGWMWSAWFGYFNRNLEPWVYHMQHGWLYEFGTDPASVVFWDSGMAAFWWTGNGTYPYLYRFSDNAWLWYLKDSANPRWFRNLKTGQWEQR